MSNEANMKAEKMCALTFFIGNIFSSHWVLCHEDYDKKEKGCSFKQPSVLGATINAASTECGVCPILIFLRKI